MWKKTCARDCCSKLEFDDRFKFNIMHLFDINMDGL